MAENLCRFCLDGDIYPSNPLIEPCKCRGSSRYVHVKCIRRWRLYTTNPLFVTQCQLCLSTLHLPEIFPLEYIPPDPVDPRFEIPTLIPPTLGIKVFLFFYVKHILSQSIADSYMFSSTVTMNIIIYSFLRRYFPLLQTISNRSLYTKLWLTFQLDSNGERPFPFLICFVTSYCLGQHVDLFFYLYIIMFSHLYTIHIHILNEINQRSIADAC